jgi:hypothetical protein
VTREPGATQLGASKVCERGQGGSVVEAVSRPFAGWKLGPVSMLDEGRTRCMAASARRPPLFSRARRA